MENLLAYGFFQRALAAGLFIALASAVLGIFLVLKKDAMIGHGLSHVTFAGVALGLFLNILPLVAALGVAVGAAVILSRLKDKAGLYGDTAIGIVSAVGMALGILLATLSHRFNIALFHYLFGEILAVEPYEVGLTAGWALLVLFTVALNYRGLMFATFDREAARAAGIPVNRLDLLLSILAAVTVVLGMKVVGILLVAALIVLPPAAALQLASSFKNALVFSLAVSLLSVGGGILTAFLLDLPAAAVIVLLAFGFFGLSFLLRRRR